MTVYRILRLRRRPKYGNKKANCRLNHVHDSKGEAKCCDDLDLSLKGGLLLFVEQQKTFDLKVQGRLICRIRVDFFVQKRDASFEVIEFKGFETRDYRIKAKLFQAIYPDISFRVVK